MHDRGSRTGWFVVLGVYWLLQALYFVFPFDIVPDFVPVIGFADDLLGMLTAFGVTAVSIWKAMPAPAIEGRSRTPLQDRDVYEPLSPDELEAL